MNPFLMAALIASLKSCAQINNLVTGIFDNVPQGTKADYIKLIEISSRDNGDCSYPAEELTLRVEVWSEQRGSSKTKNLLHLIRNQWHQKDNWNIGYGVNVTESRWTDSQLLEASDGLTRQGVSNYLFRLTGFPNYDKNP